MSSFNFDQCSDSVPNCGKNTVPIGNFCYQYDNIIDDNYNLFTETNSLDTTSIKSTNSNYDILQCALDSNNDSNSSGFSYDITKRECVIYDKTSVNNTSNNMNKLSNNFS